MLTRVRGADPQTGAASLRGRLEAFVGTWRGFVGAEQSGARMFLRDLLAAYQVSCEPGSIFERHTIDVPTARAATRQAALFGEAHEASYTAERMDMYLPKVCVWKMKAPSERLLQAHHARLLAYWSRVRTRHMVLCNFQEFWIYDTDEEDGRLGPRLTFPLDELPAHGDALLFLRGERPDSLDRSERVTSEIASVLGRIVREAIGVATDPRRAREQVTKFVLECVFAMFAEDTDLMPSGLFTRTMRQADISGDMSAVWALFDDLGDRLPSGRRDAANRVHGPLFDRNQPRVALSSAQIHDIYCIARDFQWEGVHPEIFGSVFERALDPVQRHELGAHFTREADIARVVGPSVVIPWQERIAAIRTPGDAERVVEQMRTFHVLDPACGCGNFLYVVYREMKRLEVALARKWTHVHRSGAKRRADMRPPPPGPWFTIEQLHGIEIEGRSAFLARVVLWIGEHLASRELGFDGNTLPLKNLDKTIRHDDALAVDWPRPEGELVIVGNPPYLGVRKLRREFGDEQVERLFARYPKNRAADYVTYWFTRALEALRPGERAGYVCTNSIAQNESREASIDQVLAAGGTITDAWKSYPWPGEAAVHIGIVNWVMSPWDGARTLEGKQVLSISPGLTEAVDVTTARHLRKNEGLCFMGVTPGNEGFVVTDEQRAEILKNDPGSSAVIRPLLVGRDINREVDQRPSRWVIDFGLEDRAFAQSFPGAFKHIQRCVHAAKHSESDRKTEAEKQRWWQFVRPRPELRHALGPLKKVLVVSRVSPHLIVARQPATHCFDGALMVFTLDEAYHFGVLQSRLHSIWAWARGSTLKGDLRYTNTTIFETFPLPPLSPTRYVPGVRPAGSSADLVARTAESFDRTRSVECQRQGLGLTKIHNQLESGEPSPLRDAYDAMNDAVTAHYRFPEGVWRDERETLRLLLQLNHHVATLS